MLHVSNTRQSLVNRNVDYFFSIPYVKGGGPRVEEWCENPVSCEKCMQLALQGGEELERATGSGIFHTQKRIYVSSKFRESLAI